MSQPGNAPVSRGGYLDIETIDDEDAGVRAVISQRRGHNKYTFALFKVFTRDGIEERTSFFEPERHARALIAMIPKVEKRIAELEGEQPRAGRRLF
jgi:hypothetical protein